MSHYNQNTSLRDTYKFLENLTTQDFKDEISLLQSLMIDIVDHKDFEILGGRIWELEPAENRYCLRYQYGVETVIPEGYTVPLEDQSVLTKLVKQKVVLNYETDSVLKDKGIKLYSVTGVGDIIKLRGNKYFKYLLSFNAEQILQSFYETLSIINSVASVSLKELSSKARELKIQKDILKASEIQRNLLPDHNCRFYEYDIYGICTSASFVGGDYFDFINNTSEEEERLGIVVSDAASKGLPAAIQALFVSGAIKMAMSFAVRISQFLSRLNNLVFETFPYERFVTMFYAELTHTRNGLVLFANAGHPPAIHYHRKKDKFKKLSSTGGFLGLLENQRFAVDNISMKNGDVLVIYTDGITEARNIEGELFGEKRITEIIKQYCQENAQHIALMIVEAVQIFTAGSDFADDQTLVVIKRDEKKPPETPAAL